MKHTATSSPENKRYNDESMVLDGLYEFHPELFKKIEAQELQSLKTYYLTGQDVPDNVFEYRAKLIKNNAHIQKEAHAAFEKICRLAGIE